MPRRDEGGAQPNALVIMVGYDPALPGGGMKDKAKKTSDELRPEYNFDYSKAIRGKYYKRILEEGANVAMLEPDVAEAFADSAAVNDALRSLLDLARTTERLTKRSSESDKARR